MWDVLDNPSGTQTAAANVRNTTSHSWNWSEFLMGRPPGVCVYVCVSLHVTHAHLDQYKPHSSSIQGLVAFQCLNISWKQKKIFFFKKKRSWTVDVSKWLDINNPDLLPKKIARAVYMFAFTEIHGKIWFLKLHRKPLQIASCLRPPLSPFHCVITSLSWKCGHSSTLFTYSVYQAGSLSPGC